jgi:hypothetical protein
MTSAKGKAESKVTRKPITITKDGVTRPITKEEMTDFIAKSETAMAYRSVERVYIVSREGDITVTQNPTVLGNFLERAIFWENRFPGVTVGEWLNRDSLVTDHKQFALNTATHWIEEQIETLKGRIAQREGSLGLLKTQPDLFILNRLGSGA